MFTFCEQESIRGQDEKCLKLIVQPDFSIHREDGLSPDRFSQAYKYLHKENHLVTDFFIPWISSSLNRYDIYI